MDLTNIGTNIALQQLKDKGPVPGKNDDPVSATPGEVLNGFGQILKDNFNQVNKLQNEAEQATQTFAVGGPVELHQVMIATERAELSLELTMQIRNKLVQAYQEISRMGV